MYDISTFGSAAEYGRPCGTGPLTEDSPCRPMQIYGHAKFAATIYLAAAARKGLHYNLLRVFNPIGTINSPHQVLGTFLSRAAQARKAAPPHIVRMGRLDAVREFIAVDDGVVLVVRLLELGSFGHVINVCSGQGRQVRELVTFLAGLSDLALEVDEQGGAPAKFERDIVIGDPARFIAILGRDNLTPIEDVLVAAWRRAVGEGRE